MRWIVAQIGGREHYAVARALHRRGQLRALYTEAWCRCGASILRRAPRSLRALAARRHSDLPNRLVTSFTLQTLCDQALGRQRPLTGETWHPNAIRIGHRFCLRVNRRLARLDLDPRQDVYFGYNTGCLETLEHLRDRGVAGVVDQIDPGQTEHRIVAEESKLWRGWESRPDPVPQAYYDRLSTEWSLARLVVVNSPWSQRAMIEQGVPAEKIAVVPLAYEPEHPGVPRPRTDRPLTVLWLGTVVIRKGIQYLIEAAGLLAAKPIRFVVAGQVLISDAALRGAPSSMRFVGPVTRDRAAELYRAADLFVLPTLSDGFAITQIEAMAYGLPVIATPHCGEVVTPGIDGQIVPARDPRTLAQAIERYDDDRETLARHSAAAIEKSRQFSLRRVAELLHDYARGLSGGNSASTASSSIGP